MRKLKLQMQITLDGFVSTGPNDEQQWVTWAWDEIKPYVLSLCDTTDTIVLGRKLAVDFIPYWLETVRKPEEPMHALAQRIVAAKKIIFTKTLKDAPWPDTELIDGDLVEEIKKLKQLPGKDIYACGGSSFVASLIKERLVDEFHLFLNPVALGKGEPIFHQLENWQNFELKQSITYPSGLVLLNYALAW